ncbi:hypothetical protein A2291_04055 [candidate division WOR-1 bacterium RIFOXYB2_FULL_42_35]|uniref:Addiction module toxin RelE n=1 Tax=candidate division WOR-1 bacterium RIFOXYC2_FULL_41_25 TaxID=1802586 RepID=A0A1F4TMU3_UNCSA|nr:MAG: hypothetical protein A2247_00895 [candidate division WOR-1 bacterium RIFOXYA2_FULL_41_14]OGC24304.1 MAG: hypothetical protein A2291_04055 [candidate division WOR-1 bacterium RIFOXYB2_FULL_42_35]OGC34006.1 MAG: hypothetical protein A2462_01460 [candidate division WOR-1 bacterium RIFOXYC2_FULL_41_25]OGC43126.1 MAG: hypothetical protein A2548_04380 [candidate division WOR-1 bacterium RIFOXYD2_FULL_41_8]
MKYYFKSSFQRHFKRLEGIQQKQVVEAIEALKSVFEAGYRPEGLGFKRLAQKLWEIRSSLKQRIVFSFENDVITFVIVGNHDDVVKFLKSV